MRLAILQAWGRRQKHFRDSAAEHEAAKTEAATWFKENPR
jgi:hypothetical protein